MQAPGAWVECARRRTAVARDHEGGGTGLRGIVELDIILEEQPHHIASPRLASGHQRRLAGCERLVRVGFGVEQELHHTRTPSDADRVERRRATLARAAVHVDQIGRLQHTPHLPHAQAGMSAKSLSRGVQQVGRGGRGPLRTVFSSPCTAAWYSTRAFWLAEST